MKKVPLILGSLMALNAGLSPFHATAETPKFNSSMGVGVYFLLSGDLSTSLTPLFNLKGSLGVDFSRYLSAGFNVGYATGKVGEHKIKLSQIESLLNLNIPTNNINLRAGIGPAVFYSSKETSVFEETIVPNQDPFVTYGYDGWAAGIVAELGLDFFDGSGKNKFYVDASGKMAKGVSGLSITLGFGKKF